MKYYRFFEYIVINKVFYISQSFNFCYVYFLILRKNFLAFFICRLIIKPRNKIKL